VADRAGGRAGQLESSRLRPGWTTGACATAAARAAWVALVTGEFPDPVTIELPLGRTPAFALTAERLDREGDAVVAAMAAVTKDAGDDPDVTHGAVVRATVRLGAPGSGIVFAAGPGVGTVTLPGLPLAIGEPAINPGPRTQITDNLAAAASALGREVGDVVVQVAIDDGEELARHTLNARIGVLGGLSVLGTTGVVVPYSCSAWIDSIRRGIDVARATGQTHVAACTGSTSESVARQALGLPDVALLDMGDFAGAVLKYLRTHPVPRLTIVGGVAKLAKLAQGHLDLHSARSATDHDQLAALAREVGAGERVVTAVREASTVLGAVEVCRDAGVALGDAVAAAARREVVRLLRRADIAVTVVCIDRLGAVVGSAAHVTPPIDAVSGVRGRPCQDGAGGDRSATISGAPDKPQVVPGA